MSDDGIVNVKSRILKIFSELDDIELDSIEHWISSQSYKRELEKMKLLNKSDKYLKRIGNAIKKLVPLEAEVPTEKIVMPTVGNLADCTKTNTCHMDEFLYDDDQVEELVKQEKIHRHYCVDCHSRNTKDLIFVSHSMSRPALLYIFKVLVPEDLDGKQFLDIGSRMGVVLFAAFHLSNASTIIGVEMNKELCEIQENIKDQFMSADPNRIKIVNSDIMKQKNIIHSSDVIVINVLDFFVDVQKHREMWYFFKEHIKKGSYIILPNRSIPDTLGGLGIYEEFADWLSVCRPCQMENEILFDIEEFDYTDIHLYIVN